jgi:hypothetical protein
MRPLDTNWLIGRQSPSRFRPQRRAEIARIAANARWTKVKGKKNVARTK